MASGLFLARLAAGQGSSACDIPGLDTSGGFDSSAVAGAPVITSAQIIGGGANQLYNYAVQATDSKGASLAYVLREAPTGMAISADGVISWAKPVAGTWNVTVRADNGRAYAEQRYQLTVGQQVPLDANLRIAPQVINQGVLTRRSRKARTYGRQTQRYSRVSRFPQLGRTVRSSAITMSSRNYVS